MTGAKIEYTELSKAKINDLRYVVISERSGGGFTVAQQVNVDESGDVSSVFLKGAFHVKDRNCMEAFADAVSSAIVDYDARHAIDDEDGINWDDNKCEIDEDAT